MNTPSSSAHAIDAEPEHHAHELTLPSGTRMRFLDAGAGPQLPLVLLHGLTDSSFSWTRVIGDLAALRRVVAVDLRGHGGSSKPAEGYALADHAADVLALLDALDLSRVVVVGHSMGSFVARQIAATDPDRVAGLVLVGSGGSPRTPATLELEQAVAELSDPVPVEFARAFQYGTIHQPVPNAFMEAMVTGSVSVPAHVWRDALAGMLAGPDETRALSMPTLIVWGEHDQIFSARDQHELCARLPHAVVEVYTDTGHTPHWERPEQFVTDIERFCAQL